MAKLQGFSPIITTSSLKHEAWLKSLGATHIIDRSRPVPDILAELPKITGGKPIVYAYDSIGDPETQNMGFDALAPGGGLVSTLLFTDPVLKEKIARGNGSKKLARPFASYQLPGNKALGVEIYKRLTEWLETGVVVVSQLSWVEFLGGWAMKLTGPCSRTGLRCCLVDWRVSRRAVSA